MDSLASAPVEPVPRLRARSCLLPGPLGRRIQPETFGFTLLLGLLGALPPLSIDISAPTLIVVQSRLSTSVSMVALIITLFMVGFAVGQFAAGPLSDRRGRRPILMLGLAGYTLAAIGCCLASGIVTLVAWRFVQGIGAGACAVLTFAMIRDLFEGDEARAKRSYITVVFGVAPMLAPLLGAWILDHAGWRPVYLALAAGGLVLLLTVVFGVGESRSPSADAPGSALGASYRAVLSDHRFMQLVAVNALSYGAVFAYIAGSPLVLIGSLGMSPAEYGGAFACTAGSLTAGAWISGRSARSGISCSTLLGFGLGIGAVSALALALLFWTSRDALPILLAVLMVNLFARGLTAPNVQHLALEPMREQAGTAAAAIGVIQILSGAASSAVLALLFPVLGPATMALVMAVLAGAAMLLWATTRPPARLA